MLSLTLALAMSLACKDAVSDTGDEPVLVLPPGFPEMRIPQDNPLTAEKVELGRYLFYDTRLSGNETQSCGSCHKQELAFTDGRRVGLGSTGQEHVRNANGLSNVGYNSTLTWANPILTELEEQFLLPLFGDGPVELGAAPYQDEILERLRADPDMVAMFQVAFEDEAVSWDNILMAIASFNRTMVTGNSPFDKFTYQGDAQALNDAALRGLAVFYSEELECHHCHGGFNFSEATVHVDSVFDAALFQNTGLYNIDGEGSYPGGNAGLYEITGEPGDMGRFRAPSLRNIELTAPYMHDGSVETLEEVIRIYERGGRLIEEGPWAGDGALSPLKSGIVAGFELSDQERDDLIAFLNSLTDPTFVSDPALSDPYVE